jgi:hypothetical protein
MDDQTEQDLRGELELSRYLYRNPGTTTPGRTERTLGERLARLDRDSRRLRQYLGGGR